VTAACAAVTGAVVAGHHGFTPPALAHAVSAVVAALAWHVAAMGAGVAILARVAPRALDDEVALAFAAIVGLGAWGLAGLALGALGLLAGPGIALTAALLSAGWLGRAPVRLPALPAWLLVVLLVSLVPGLVRALAPPTDVDELYYHLAIPRLVLERGELVGGFLHPDGSRPLALHLPFAMLLWTAGDSAVRVYALGLAAVLLGTVFTLARETAGPRGALVAVLLLVGSWSFANELGLASSNLATALACLLALRAALRADARLLAVAAGVALSLKYTAAGVVAGALLVAPIGLRARSLAGLGAVAIVAPWWIRNAVEGLHPLFPFLGWSSLEGFRFQYLDKYGQGRDLVSLVELPWHLIMSASPERIAFLGRLHPGFLALAPVGLFLSVRGPMRRVAIATVVALALWAMGPQWIRYLLPALPLVAWIAGSTAGASRVSDLAIAGLLLVGVPANVAPFARERTEELEVVLGSERREHFLAREVADWPAIAWANEHVPEDARVVLLFEWAAYLVERDTVLASVEDHTPLRHYVRTHGYHTLEDLRATGATYAIVGRVGFLRSTYAFLDDETFARDFQEPLRMLEEMLLAEGELVFQDGGTRVYAL
jgi:hypothetical protein